MENFIDRIQLLKEENCELREEVRSNKLLQKNIIACLETMQIQVARCLKLFPQHPASLSLVDAQSKCRACSSASEISKQVSVQDQHTHKRAPPEEDSHCPENDKHKKNKGTSTQIQDVKCKSLESGSVHLKALLLKKEVLESSPGKKSSSSGKNILGSSTAANVVQQADGHNAYNEDLKEMTVSDDDDVEVLEVIKSPSQNNQSIKEAGSPKPKNSKGSQDLKRSESKGKIVKKKSKHSLKRDVGNLLDTSPLMKNGKRDRKSTDFFGEAALDSEYKRSMHYRIIYPKKDSDNSTIELSKSSAEESEVKSPMKPKANEKSSNDISGASAPAVPSVSSFKPTESPDTSYLLKLDLREIICCPCCEEYITENYQSHLDKEHPHSCLNYDCKASFLTRIAMLQHAALHHEEDSKEVNWVRFCDLCQSYIDIRSWSKHTPDSHTMKCPKCMLVYANKKPLLQHYISTHMKEETSDIKNDGGICDTN